LIIDKMLEGSSCTALNQCGTGLLFSGSIFLLPK
jgi:hypothetical protein